MDRFNSLRNRGRTILAGISTGDPVFVRFKAKYNRVSVEWKVKLNKLTGNEPLQSSGSWLLVFEKSKEEERGLVVWCSSSRSSSAPSKEKFRMSSSIIKQEVGSKAMSSQTGKTRRNLEKVCLKSVNRGKKTWGGYGGGFFGLNYQHCCLRVFGWQGKDVDFWLLALAFCLLHLHPFEIWTPFTLLLWNFTFFIWGPNLFGDFQLAT